MPQAWSRRAFLTALAATGRAQDPVFRSDVRVVNILATVTNRGGQLQRDLTAEDFVLLENGRPQTIRYFSRETDLPLTLGLLVDTSLSQEKVLSSERAASFRFLDRVLRETMDQVFIMQFDAGVFLRQKLTSNRKELDDALSLVDTPTRAELQIQGGGTRLYDAIEKSSNDILKARQGRKALILLTDGVDVRSDGTSSTAVDAAQRADALIYSIYFSAEGPEGRGVLQRMSRDTGGGFFEISRKRNFEDVFDLIQEELRSQYSLGFVSDQPIRNPEFRKLQLTARQKGLVVQARTRYWAGR